MSLRKLLYLSFTLVLMGIVTAGGALGKELYVVGAGGIPWDESAGDAIDIKTGWLWPERTDTTVNLAEGDRKIRSGIYSRGGSVRFPNIVGLSDSAQAVLGGYMVDGDSTTAFERKGMAHYGTMMELDLGGRFGVNLIRFFPRADQDFLRRYELAISEGTPETTAPWGAPIYTVIVSDASNDQDTVNVAFGTQYVRYVRIKSLTSIDFEIDEIQVFGAGFRPTATYTPEPIDFEHITTWGKIEWLEVKTGDPNASRVLVRTRTGDDDTPMIYTRAKRDPSTGKLLGFIPWRKGTKAAVSVELEDPLTGAPVKVYKGDDLDANLTVEEATLFYNWLAKSQRDSLALTEEEYKKLSDAERGQAFLDVENWGPWQPATNGDPIPSLGQRRFLQLRIELLSDALNAAAGVGFLRFEYSTLPAAHRIMAEIAPALGVDIGKPVNFTYALRPAIKEGDTGFDRLEVRTPARVDSIASTPARVGSLGSMEIGGQTVECEIESVEDDRFVISFPGVTAEQDSVLLKVSFKSVVLGYKTAFTGSVFLDADGDGRPDELPQLVVDGNAADLGEGDADRLSVEITFKERSLIGSVRVSSNPFTPNGDGWNDTVQISYNILQLTRLTPVVVEIYDLAGRLIRTVYSGNDLAGRYFRSWDGTDDSGDLAPPGIYIFRISLDADKGMVSEVGVVSVVY